MSEVTRRDAIKLLLAAGAVASTACDAKPVSSAPNAPAADEDVDPILASEALSEPPWQTRDPFLFCVHHDDHYPAGNAQLGPAVSLAGRQIGQDFAGKDGFSMYHGEVVPGFPQHPHRGFETVTVVRRGLLDHADSMGAAARYGEGDVQWLTAGKGIQHAEMFPLLNPDRDNPVELFQIWLNLPRAHKMAEPHFSMLWQQAIPRHEHVDAQGHKTQLVVVAGQYAGKRAPSPPPNSWAAQATSDVAIWTIKMEANASFTLPSAREGTDRTLYFFRGTSLRVAERKISARHLVQLRPERDVTLKAGEGGAELLLLQGRPIEEPVAKRGPFVMNTQEEIRQAFSDYQQTQFGGWPWDRRDPVHAREEGRFARHADGRTERPA